MVYVALGTTYEEGEDGNQHPAFDTLIATIQYVHVYIIA